MSNGYRDAREIHSKLSNIINTHYAPKFGRYNLRPVDNGTLTYHSSQLHIRVTTEYNLGDDWAFLRVVRENSQEERKFRLGRNSEIKEFFDYLDRILEARRVSKGTDRVIAFGPYGPRVIR